MKQSIFKFLREVTMSDIVNEVLNFQDLQHNVMIIYVYVFMLRQERLKTFDYDSGNGYSCLTL